MMKKIWGLFEVLPNFTNFCPKYFQFFTLIKDHIIENWNNKAQKNIRPARCPDFFGPNANIN
jgi:hypothetical protein